MKKIISLFLALCLLGCLLAACKQFDGTQDFVVQTTEDGILLPDKPVTDEETEETDANSQTDTSEQNGTGAVSGQETTASQVTPENPTTDGDPQETTNGNVKETQPQETTNGHIKETQPQETTNGHIKETQPQETQSQETIGSHTQETTVQQSTTASAAPQETTTASNNSAKVYTITYTGLAGATHSNPDTYTAMTANTIILAAPSSRYGYTFTGWYIDDTLVTTLAGCTGDLTLTAKWTKGAISLPVVPFD